MTYVASLATIRGLLKRGEVGGSGSGSGGCGGCLEAKVNERTAAQQAALPHAIREKTNWKLYKKKTCPVAAQHNTLVW